MRGECMLNFKTAEFVWLGVVSLFQFAQKYTAALKAYGEIYGDGETNNPFIDISHSALWRQLISELSKIYDREKTCGEDNLSISQLRQLCLNHKAFPDGATEDILKELGSLQTRYEMLLSKELRNKKLAHYDLISAFTYRVPTILFGEVEQFVLDTSAVLTEVGERLLLGELSIGYESLVQEFKENLYKIQKSTAKTNKEQRE